jgi:hypothetical protein
MTGFTYRQMLDRLDMWKREKSMWLDNFAFGRNKRPDHEIERKREDIAYIDAMAAKLRRELAERAESEAA